VTEDGVIDNSGSFTDVDTLSILGGTVCGTAVHVGTDGGAGETLSFASHVATGTTCATGMPKDKLFVANIPGTVSGNIPAGWTVDVGDGGSSFAHVTLSTATKNAGTLESGFGATVTDASTLMNSGTLEIPSSGYTSTFVLGGLTNSKSILIKANGAITLPSGASLTGGVHGTITISKNKTLTLSGNLVSDDKVTIDAGGRLDVTGTYSQVGTGSELVIQMASATSYGELEATGTASLAGIVDPLLAGHFTPPSGTTFEVLTSAGLGGTTFGTVDGGFTAQYISSDSDVQLTAG
jgi:adhesin HecA-like repeat protein